MGRWKPATGPHQWNRIKDRFPVAGVILTSWKLLRRWSIRLFVPVAFSQKGFQLTRPPLKIDRGVRLFPALIETTGFRECPVGILQPQISADFIRHRNLDQVVVVAHDIGSWMRWVIGTGTTDRNVAGQPSGQVFPVRHFRLVQGAGQCQYPDRVWRRASVLAETQGSIQDVRPDPADGQMIRRLDPQALPGHPEQAADGSRDPVRPFHYQVDGSLGRPAHFEVGDAGFIKQESLFLEPVPVIKGKGVGLGMEGAAFVRQLERPLEERLEDQASCAGSSGLLQNSHPSDLSMRIQTSRG